METTIFAGEVWARQREARLRLAVERFELQPRLAIVAFRQDQMGLVYARLKREAAARVGIEFNQVELGMEAGTEEMAAAVRVDERVTGVVVQKPSRRRWRQVMGMAAKYENWWHRMVARLAVDKDVDCLTRVNLQRVDSGDWQVLPATVSAVIEVIKEAWPQRRKGKLRLGIDLSGLQVVVVGRSELVGRPVAAVMAQAGGMVKLYGHDVDWETVRRADLVVSATGRQNLIKGGMIKPGAVVIDVGEPKGDVDLESVRGVARLVTPVPGGVGPMTVVSLLENVVGFELAKRGTM